MQYQILVIHLISNDHYSANVRDLQIYCLKFRDTVLYIG